jgi:hypothetical protein
VLAQQRVAGIDAVDAARTQHAAGINMREEKRDR